MPDNSIIRTDERLIQKDMEQLQLTDDQFKAFTWADICEIIGFASVREPWKTDFVESGQVHKFRRWPSDLAKYISFKKEVLKTYPSMENYILATKLHWPDPPIAHSSIPYSDPRDFQIRINDWPYAFLPDVTHIVVWSAFRFPSGTTTDEQMLCCDDFVGRHFGEILADNRRWFLNWGSIQSVPGLEHFHVLLRNAPEEFVQKITTCPLNGGFTESG